MQYQRSIYIFEGKCSLHLLGKLMLSVEQNVYTYCRFLCRECDCYVIMVWLDNTVSWDTSPGYSRYQQSTEHTHQSMRGILHKLLSNKTSNTSNFDRSTESRLLIGCHWQCWALIGWSLEQHVTHPSKPLHLILVIGQDVIGADIVILIEWQYWTILECVL